MSFNIIHGLTLLLIVIISLAASAIGLSVLEAKRIKFSSSFLFNSKLRQILHTLSQDQEQNFIFHLTAFLGILLIATPLDRLLSNADLVICSLLWIIPLGFKIFTNHVGVVGREIAMRVVLGLVFLVGAALVQEPNNIAFSFIGLLCAVVSIYISRAALITSSNWRQHVGDSLSHGLASNLLLFWLLMRFIEGISLGTSSWTIYTLTGAVLVICNVLLEGIWSNRIIKRLADKRLFNTLLGCFLLALVTILSLKQGNLF